ncbi:MAG: 23S rRNA (adenine(2030)-N(6))-methyltransferase RlmJ [Gammaproteobacteria bacterium]|nr:23S rRNA (adenine(2030)-N(6))-methyltransferase RlmJ [Gammaproteobacteria bacterium]
MNYRHIYHAGNFGDVFKHVLLLHLIETLKNKLTPFCYLDTHAGIGLYDLQSIEAQKTQEHHYGIDKILALDSVPAFLDPYRKLICEYNKCLSTANGACSFYPGSPLLVRQLLREQDRMILCELHPDDYQKLKRQCYVDKRIHVHHQDGYACLNALLPPQERRGLVLIDPSYEVVDELEQVVFSLKLALKKWPTGIYAIWYPLKDNLPINLFLKKIRDRIHQNVLLAEMSVFHLRNIAGLTGCGMLIINPPWHIEILFKKIVAWLWDQLAVDRKTRYRVTWLHQST